MNAVTTEALCGEFLDAPPVLVAGDSAAAIDRAVRTVESYGLRVGARLPIAEARDRIEIQPSATAIWIEIDSDCDPELDRLLDQVGQDAAAGRFGVVVAAPGAMLDPLASRIGDGDVELVIDGREADRLAALALAATSLRPERVSDVASDQNAARLRQLSDEVSRIASTLARLSSGPTASPAVPVARPVEDAPPVSADLVRSVIRARRLRSRYFEPDLFADPAWDMLLDLLQAEIAQLRVPVSSLCIAAAVPATTALRWLKTMTSKGLFVRRADPHDGRRVFVELAPQTSLALRRYFAEVGDGMAI